MTTTKAGWLAGDAHPPRPGGWALDFPSLGVARGVFDCVVGVHEHGPLFVCGALLVPLSVNLSEFGLTSIGWYMPTEPMLFALMLLFAARWVSGKLPHRQFLRHPMTWVIGLGLAWMGFTILPSSDMVVSLKASQAWFVVSFTSWLAWVRRPTSQGSILALLAIPLCGVIAYTLVRHGNHGFSKQAGHWVMKPFFKDHTSYGAVLAMMLPPAVAMAWRTHQSSLARVLWSICTGWLALCIVFSSPERLG